MKHKATNSPASRRRMGRPLSFDRDVALERAMHVFWRYGYETSSIADLTAAMGITPPSLYTAFGDKKRLFLEAVDLYAGDMTAMAGRIANASNARDAACDLLYASAVAFTGDKTPPGCLLASATASGSSESAEVQRAVAAIRQRVAEALQMRIERDLANGILAHTTDASALANLVVAVIQGMSVLARDGMERAALMALADASLQGWHCAVS